MKHVSYGCNQLLGVWISIQVSITKGNMTCFCMTRHTHICKNQAIVVMTTGIPIARNIQFSKTNLIKAIGVGDFSLFHRQYNEEGFIHLTPSLCGVQMEANIRFSNTGLHTFQFCIKCNFLYTMVLQYLCTAW